jgi:hypothetical protein
VRHIDRLSVVLSGGQGSAPSAGRNSSGPPIGTAGATSASGHPAPNIAGPLLQVIIANYQISKSLMGPIPGGNEEELTVTGLGKLADMPYPERRSSNYPDKDGYDLTISSNPDSWGDVTVTVYRIDAGNDFKAVDTKMFAVADRAQGSLTVSGKMVRQRQPLDAVRKDV